MAATFTRDGILRMLEEQLAPFGMSVGQFVEFGRADALDDPTLRDLWLIWGDVADTGRD